MVTRDSVAITGSVVGLLSFLLGWLTLKPNRIAAGTSLNLGESVGWGEAAVILALWLVCLALSLMPRGRVKAVMLGVAANLILIATFLLVGLAASRLLEGEESFARVSLSSGIWITAA